VNRRELREKIGTLRKEQTKDQVLEKSKRVKERLFTLRKFLNSRKVTFYVSKKIDGEVDTEQMIRDSIHMMKRVLVPITNKPSRRLIFSELKDYDKELESGVFGIPEPKEKYRRIVPPEDTDLVIVPGIVFDLRGYRLGYGFGYYDRFLSMLNPDTPTIGLAFEFQVVEAIPNEEHDIPVHLIITEEKVIFCKQTI
jgi:5-formyltetrahydrofolate cyclo-ligase